MDLQQLAELESEDDELVPEILPVDARLSIKGKVAPLAALFERTLSVTPVKEVLPGTMYTLLEAVPGSARALSYVRVTGTDGERAVAVVDDSLTVIKPGAALMPGKRILEILKLAPDESVRIDIFGATATIRSGRALWTVQVPFGDALPPLPETSAIELHPVHAKSFLSALVTARKAVATSTARSSLMQASVAHGRITACDSARVHRQMVESLPDALEMTLPVKLMDEAIRALRGYEDEIFHVGANHHVVVFHFNRDVLIGLRLVVDFPDIEPLLLAPVMMNQQTLTVDRQELIDSIKRVRINSDPDYASIYLYVTPQDDRWLLGIRARDLSGNTSQEVLDVAYEGGSKAREICVNHQYLIDLLTSLDSEEVVFKLGEDVKTKPAPLLVSDGMFTGVITPMTANLVQRAPR